MTGTDAEKFGFRALMSLGFELVRFDNSFVAFGSLRDEFVAELRLNVGMDIYDKTMFFYYNVLVLPEKYTCVDDSPGSIIRKKRIEECSPAMFGILEKRLKRYFELLRTFGGVYLPVRVE